MERATDSGFTQNLTLVTTTAANATSYSNTGLSASTTYYYRVRATNASGDSANSNSASATTQAVAAAGTIDIDFGPTGSSYSGTAAAPTTGTTWNPYGWASGVWQTGYKASSLKDSNGNTTAAWFQEMGGTCTTATFWGSIGVADNLDAQDHEETNYANYSAVHDADLLIYRHRPCDRLRTASRTPSW